MDLKQHHAAIRDAIEAAKADGFEVDIMNGCCGCSKMSLEIGPEDLFWEDETVQVLIMGERRNG